MIAVCVRNNGAGYGLPGINIKITLGAINTFFGKG
jgi:hypothetical protein